MFRTPIQILLGATLGVAAGVMVLAGADHPGAGEPRDALACISCHLDHGARGHPVNVLPRGTLVPPEWPLDALGRVTCVTCHGDCDMEPSDGDTSLRGNARGWAFCASCHDGGSRSPAVEHARVLPVAHFAEHDADAATRRCGLCHDGTVAPPAELVEPLRGPGVRSVDPRASHPVGVTYPPREERHSDALWVPRSRLDPRVALPDGRVACTSCHDLYSREPGLLVMSNRESRLCFACHDM